MNLNRYDVVALTDAVKGFLQDLPAPIIPATIYSELVYTAQGTVCYTVQTTGALRYADTFGFTLFWALWTVFLRPYEIGQQFYCLCLSSPQW